MREQTLIYSSMRGNQVAGREWCARFLSSCGVYIPFRCLAELDEIVADLQSAALAQVTDGLRWVQTCWWMYRLNLGAKVVEQLSGRFEACYGV